MTMHHDHHHPPLPLSHYCYWNSSEDSVRSVRGDHGRYLPQHTSCYVTKAASVDESLVSFGQPFGLGGGTVPWEWWVLTPYRNGQLQGSTSPVHLRRPH